MYFHYFDFFFLIIILLIDKWTFDICRLMLKPEVFLFVQPNIYVYHWWGYCWNFGIYWLDWICLLFPCHGNYFNRTHGKGWVYNPFILWFVEPDYIWRHSGWAYGTHLDHLLVTYWWIVSCDVLLIILLAWQTALPHAYLSCIWSPWYYGIK